VGVKKSDSQQERKVFDLKGLVGWLIGRLVDQFIGWLVKVTCAQMLRFDLMT